MVPRCTRSRVGGDGVAALGAVGGSVGAEVAAEVVEAGGERGAEQLAALLGGEQDLQPVVAGPHDVDPVGAGLGDVAHVVAEQVELVDVAAEHPAAGLGARVGRAEGREHDRQRGALGVLGQRTDQPDQALHRCRLVTAGRGHRRLPSNVWACVSNLSRGRRGAGRHRFVS